MVYFKKAVLLVFILSFTNKLEAQRQCGFEIDSVAIYFDQNLDTLLAFLKKDNFIDYQNKNNIPKLIKDQLDCITGDFSMANPKEAFRCCCTSPDSLPLRKLLFLGISPNLIVISYIKGAGIVESPYILLVRYHDKKIVDLWNATPFALLNSRKEIVRYINKNRSGKSLHLNLGM